MQFAGWLGGYGYLLEIDHGGGYTTSYGHLSAFGHKIAAGKSVMAGEIIGYVGDTGYSTGPHLHFEFSRNDQKLDYLTARVYAGEALSGAELNRFHITRDAKLALLRDGTFQVSRLRKLTSY